MSSESPDLPTSTPPAARKSARSAPITFFLRGLAISLPPILTLVILVWIGQLIYGYVVYPTSTIVRYTIAQFIDESKPTSGLVAPPVENPPRLEDYDGKYLVTRELRSKLEEKLEEKGRPLLRTDLDLNQVYIPIGDRTWAVPYDDYELVAKNVPTAELPKRVIGTPFEPGLYMEIVTHKHFQGLFHLSAIAVLAIVVLLYFLGRFVTARIGAWIVHKIETAVLGRLPVVRNVYASVKQVTDFIFSERTVEYNRVVAVQYPRRGVWSLGFVTGDSLLEVTAAAGEPMLTVLMPTSPMPMTGFTINVPRREILDLNITVDQAFQYCLSCGVLVPPQQKVTPELLQQELAKRLAAEGVGIHHRDRTPGSDGEQWGGTAGDRHEESPHESQETEAPS